MFLLDQHWAMIVQRYTRFQKHIGRGGDKYEFVSRVLPVRWYELGEIPNLKAHQENLKELEY